MLLGILTLLYFSFGILIAFIIFNDIDGTPFEIFSCVLAWPLLVAYIMASLLLIGLYGAASRIGHNLITIWYLLTKKEN